MPWICQAVFVIIFLDVYLMSKTKEVGLNSLKVINFHHLEKTVNAGKVT